MAEATCDKCGDVFERIPSELEGKENVFCSRECYDEFGRPNMAGEGNPNHKEKVEIVCESCGDVFEVHPCREDSARFCSEDCHANYMKGRTGPEARSWEGGGVERVCENCGERYTDKSSTKTKYCSKECYYKSMEKDGKNHKWVHKDYGENWEKQREKAIKRDSRTCQDCGVHERDMKRGLDVHHKKAIDWFKEEFDAPAWYEKGNKIENLVSLCRSCHMSREIKNREFHPSPHE